MPSEQPLVFDWIYAGKFEVSVDVAENMGEFSNPCPRSRARRGNLSIVDSGGNVGNRSRLLPRGMLQQPVDDRARMYTAASPERRA